MKHEIRRRCTKNWERGRKIDNHHQCFHVSHTNILESDNNTPACFRSTQNITPQAHINSCPYTSFVREPPEGTIRNVFSQGIVTDCHPGSIQCDTSNHQPTIVSKNKYIQNSNPERPKR